MRYFVQVAGREHAVDLTTRPDGTTVAAVGGRSIELDVVAFSPRELLVKVGTRVMDLTVEGAPPQLGVVASGRRTYVQVESERMRTAQRATRPDDRAERDLRAPMPGRVVKVLVAEGQAVGPGQPVAIVEAMKMENEVRARRGGTVAKVHVAAGATVEANALLVTFG